MQKQETTHTKEWVIEEEKELHEAATWVASQWPAIHVVCLSGNLGAGKTTFSKYIVQAMGGNVHEVSSPTFSLVNVYVMPPPCARLFHMDLYRLENMEEALGIGIEEYLDSGSLCLIEWPDIILPLLPPIWINIDILFTDNGRRKLTASIREHQI